MKEVFFNPKYETKKQRCNIDSRKKPEGHNPLFYCEKQEKRHCMKHSMNALLGYDAIPLESFAKHALTPVKENIAQVPRSEKVQMAEAYLSYDQERFNKEYEENADKLLTSLAREQYQLFNGVYPEESDSTAGFSPDTAKLVMKELRPDLPEFNVDWLEDPTGNDNVLKKNKQQIENLMKEGGPDRLIYGNDVHLVAFRKNVEGDWFLVDSENTTLQRIDPLQYYEEYKDAGASNVIMHFGKEVPFD
ncbi:hypothetical protein PsAD5_02221 [Pseudovibrio sp. Ad5]|uniref:hypothetical protein n=1 Tax=Pseudovibrio sp. Ad5 TaxID=989436 RepID=UPI0007B2ABEE|nr:hypothetical protein [Pseudovibrio sp. Ad5]KZK97982.1 hypothetical protein PsAD5_02221 [Pseudovibrio sp. Ad5]